MIYLGVSSYIAESRGRQDKRGNMLGENADSCLLPGMTTVTNKPELVHIVADNSTKQAAEHHRHSTKEIVGILLFKKKFPALRRC